MQTNCTSKGQRGAAPEGPTSTREAPRNLQNGAPCRWGLSHGGGPVALMTATSPGGPGRACAHPCRSLHPAPTRRRQALGVRGVPGVLAAPLHPSLGLPGRESQ